MSGLRKAESTLASYKKNIRLHLKPYIGSIPLASLTSAKITALYVMSEKEGGCALSAGFLARRAGSASTAA
ncbi:N-terminal phage integrase SAM-like domain-containing protein [Microbispora sp. H10836]|uniref:N-terminal phage integrase SAM-like domain-containing protein n=1 Tax=Microbispora sp. H10836 TaxID=2729106 RepID=UPI001472EA4C|nr:N-terminal phage integrase SAM-like domain-containing protein [Microbispora sp. H10836]